MATVGGTEETRAEISADEEHEPAAAEVAAGEPASDEPAAEEPAAEARTGMTPRQARRVRAAVSAAVMVAVAVILVLRLERGPSLVMVGLYGVALILCGTAIVLSRRGRTRVATAVLLGGFAVVAVAEWLTPTVV